MLDIDLIVETLRSKGHVVGPVFAVPENAGGEQFTVDGQLLTMSEVNVLLAAETAERPW